MNHLRSLTEPEISRLTRQQCRCENWSLVHVGNEFCTDNFFDVQFSGNIQLGCFNHTFVSKNGIRRQAGIYRAQLHNCIVEDNAYINGIGNYIANYHIGQEAFIENVDCLSVDRATSFGNGTKAALLDETGSRKLILFDGLTAQLAYLLTLCRHKPQAIEKINALINQYTKEKTSTQGYIGRQAHISNCGTLRNIFVGDNAHIYGASLLQNGSINSKAEAPVTVGCNVIARDFILASGCTLSDAAQIERCFVGQGSILSEQFSASDSVFFANCQGFHGEAISVFAGPYTVTHHKSTLLIGGMFSFFNAGSGSNQSNHMYKLGPIHYGIVDRGSKMASDSYIPWPSRIGAFSLIMGKHKNKMDTSALPFSYLVADRDETIIIPGLCLQNIGTYRDVDKWPARDGRTDELKQDLISYPLFNPYTVQQIIRGKHLLITLLERDKNVEEFIFLSNKIKIKRSAAQRGLRLYQQALNLYVGEALFLRINKRESLQSEESAYVEWMDLGGFVAPRKRVNELLDSNFNSLKEIQSGIDRMANSACRDEWNFVLNLISETDIKSVRKADFISFLSGSWISAQKELIEQLTLDAAKEFSPQVKVVYGIDQNEEDKQLEFKAIRGSIEDNAFLKHFIENMEKQMSTASGFKA